MKLLMLADPANPHTLKWVRSLAAKRIEILLFGLRDAPAHYYANLDNVQVYTSLQMIGKDSQSSGFSKLSYLQVLPRLFKICRKFQPDIVHAHYASSYGLLGALLNREPYVISVWGADVYEFPRTSAFHRWLLRYNLRKATMICSTSHVMSAETSRYTDKPIEVVAFGVDLTRFKPRESSNSQQQSWTVGTIKTLEYKYGIDILLKSFDVFVRQYQCDARLIIAGGGADTEALTTLASSLASSDRIQFLGFVDPAEIPDLHQQFDVFVSLSRLDSESFGVAIVEAMATATPVIVSNRGGLPEVVDQGSTGFVVESENIEQAVRAMHKLFAGPECAKAMGQAGRKKVEHFYDWNSNVEQMESIYQRLIA